jgi:acetoin utilization deacetylase AcuC-like enzyme
MPRWAAIDQLKRVHPLTYLSSVAQPEQIRRVFGQGVSSEDAERHVEQQRWMVGGTIRAARASLSLLGPKTVVNLGGGFHHAYADGGYAFCVFNDVAVAIAHLRQEGYRHKILVIDLDLHQGDGTREIFAADDSVFTFSLHAENWTEQEFDGDRNVALGPGIDDASYLAALRDELPAVLERAQPQLVFYVAGVDVAADDQLGGWRLSPNGILRRDRYVLSLIGKLSCVWLLAGGYGPDAWRHSARSLADLTASWDAPIPTLAQRDIELMREVKGKLNIGELVEDGSDPDDFGIRPEDLFGPLAGHIGPQKLLGFYTKYGLECAFEAYGVFEHIRSLGYGRLELELDTNHSTGQLLRIRSADAREDLLVELVLDERLDMPPFRLLWLEWLLLQNPRGRATPTRPLLPGQKYPGLGCLHRVIGMILMACERLGYDGMAFHPGHYHTALFSKAEGVFAEPEIEARFRFSEALTADLSVAEASSLLAEGLILDDQAEPFKWQPARMVLPVSERLKARFSRPVFGEQVAREARRLRARFASRSLPGFRAGMGSGSMAQQRSMPPEQAGESSARRWQRLSMRDAVFDAPPEE